MASTYTRRHFLKIIGGALVATAIPPVIETVLRNTDNKDPFDLITWPERHPTQDLSEVAWDSENCDPIADLQAVVRDIVNREGWTSSDPHIYVSEGTYRVFISSYGEGSVKGVMRIWPGIKDV